VIPAIELRGLTKDFVSGLRGSRLRALDGVTLQVGVGEVFGVLGPNGSGKSTLLKILLGLLEPNAGAAAIFGVSCARLEARRAVGYLPEAPWFHRFLTGEELVTFHARLAGLAAREVRGRVGEVLARVGLGEAAQRKIGTYSKGMLQRIGLAQALVHRPRLLVLDEPAAGVDVAGIEALTALIRELRDEGVTVFVTSHVLGQIEDVCDRVALLHRGRVVAEGTVAELAGETERWTLAGPALAPDDLRELEQWLAGRGGALEKRRWRRPELERLLRECASVSGE
jgi:ABC-2 type transport system ATP-binding protein